MIHMIHVCHMIHMIRKSFCLSSQAKVSLGSNMLMTRDACAHLPTASWCLPVSVSLVRPLMSRFAFLFSVSCSTPDVTLCTVHNKL